MKILFEQIKKSFLSINIIENSALIETDSNYSLKKALVI